MNEPWKVGGDVVTGSSIRVLDGPVFHLHTSAASLIMRVGQTGHLLLDWFASPVKDPCEVALAEGEPVGGVPGMVVTYGPTRASRWSLGEASLAFSTAGKGDFRTPALRIDGSGVLDFTYVRHEVVSGTIPLESMPQASPEPASQSLIVTLADAVATLECDLIFTTFPDSGVITSRTVVRNLSGQPLRLTHLSSCLCDLDVSDPEVITFNGHWLGEANAHREKVGFHRINASLTGSSNTEHNPGIVLLGAETNESSGWCYGVNLIYSGNHRTSLETSAVGTTRIVSGIHPEGFSWPISPGGQFTAPEAVLCYSDHGLNDMSQRMHRFVNQCVIPEYWRDRERPVVMNSWEAAYFDIDANSLLTTARASAELGAEVFVVDDGWFGRRVDDRRSLGDWRVNEEKFPDGLAHFADQLADIGMGLGLWFEPEAVNADSDLYRRHPDWAIAASGRVPSEGRYEYLLDLSRPEVRDYVVSSVGDLLDSVDIRFVKWDMNRLHSDVVDGDGHHRYLLGLYEVLDRIFSPRPHILLETCSSGGNRFDLAMLSFGPQIWASDCTDPLERLAIQRGLSYLYPRSAISAHISASPNHQTGRASSIGFRFAVSALYTLGLELDPATLSVDETEQLRAAIAWYRQNRRTVQLAPGWRGPISETGEVLCVGESEDLLIGVYETIVSPRRPRVGLRAPATPGHTYDVSVELEEPRSAGGSSAADESRAAEAPRAAGGLSAADESRAVGGSRAAEAPRAADELRATGGLSAPDRPSEAVALAGAALRHGVRRPGCAINGSATLYHARRRD